jgi:hypothetical protein
LWMAKAESEGGAMVASSLGRAGSFWLRGCCWVVGKDSSSWAKERLFGI